MKFNYLRIAALFLCLPFLIACSSEAEKVERRENSYDVSGDYKMTLSTGSEVEMLVSIRNEAGRHDIVATLDRQSALTEKERVFLETQGIDIDYVRQILSKSLVLGQGKDSNHLEGGENISTDFGLSSRFYVCSKAFTFNSETRLSICLNGTAKKQEQLMSGTLELNVTKTKKEIVNGKEEISSAFHRISVAYKTDASLIFFKQYLGQWSGQAYPLVANFDATVLKKILLKENGADTFTASLPAVPSIKFNQEIYAYDPRGNVQPLSILKQSDYPAVQVVFYGPYGRRIVVFGQLWSLGNLTGTITLILPDRQTDLATFRMKKDQ